MKIIFSDLKKGIIKLKVDNTDDMWHLSHVIDVNDIVEAVTYRKEEKREDIARSITRERKKVKLSLKVEKVELKDFLRIAGEIIEGGDTLRSHHTFNIKSNDTLKIIKEHWSKTAISRLKEAERTTNKPLVFLLVLDDESADFAILRQTNVNFVFNLSGFRRGKQFESKDTKFAYFSKIITALNEYSQKENLNKIVVAGPGFIKDELYEYVKEKDIDLFKNIILTNTSVVGRTGIYELIKSKKIDKLLNEMKSVQEINAVEELLYELSKSKKATYGLKEVQNALNMGAIDKLLVIIDKIKDKGIEEIMEGCRHTKSKILIVNSVHEGGQKLLALGGIAAILRYAI